MRLAEPAPGVGRHDFPPWGGVPSADIESELTRSTQWIDTPRKA